MVETKAQVMATEKMDTIEKKLSELMMQIQTLQDTMTKDKSAL